MIWCDYYGSGLVCFGWAVDPSGWMDGCLTQERTTNEQPTERRHRAHHEPAPQGLRGRGGRVRAHGTHALIRSPSPLYHHQHPSHTPNPQHSPQHSPSPTAPRTAPGTGAAWPSPSSRAAGSSSPRASLRWSRSWRGPSSTTCGGVGRVSVGIDFQGWWSWDEPQCVDPLSHTHTHARIPPSPTKNKKHTHTTGHSSVGAHVRDAACYVCWAFARAYAPPVMRRHVPRLCEGMLVTSLFDREINCRRAGAFVPYDALPPHQTRSRRDAYTYTYILQHSPQTNPTQPRRPSRRMWAVRATRTSPSASRSSPPRTTSPSATAPQPTSASRATSPPFPRTASP